MSHFHSDRRENPNPTQCNHICIKHVSVVWIGFKQLLNMLDLGLLLFYSEAMFHRNVRMSPNYTEHCILRIANRFGDAIGHKMRWKMMNESRKNGIWKEAIVTNVKILS
jgi:hypothetical protein